MNKGAIEQAQDSDLRLSGAALTRAAKRARELAAQTGTAIIVLRDGVIRHVMPTTAETEQQIQEPKASYDAKEQGKA